MSFSASGDPAVDTVVVEPVPGPGLGGRSGGARPGQAGRSLPHRGRPDWERGRASRRGESCGHRFRLASRLGLLSLRRERREAGRLGPRDHQRGRELAPDQGRPRDRPRSERLQQERNPERGRAAEAEAGRGALRLRRAGGLRGVQTGRNPRRGLQARRQGLQRGRDDQQLDGTAGPRDEHEHRGQRFRRLRQGDAGQGRGTSQGGPSGQKTAMHVHPRLRGPGNPSSWGFILGGLLD